MSCGSCNDIMRLWIITWIFVICITYVGTYTIVAPGNLVISLFII